MLYRKKNPTPCEAPAHRQGREGITVAQQGKPHHPGTRGKWGQGAPIPTAQRRSAGERGSTQAGSLPASCAHAYRTSSSPQLHVGVTVEVLVPTKSHHPQKETREKQSPGRPTKSLENTPSLGNQPSRAPAKGGARVPVVPVMSRMNHRKLSYC